jgi:mRNA deadenylase 3'-5' endonuclease subunit Ccr4
MFQWLARFVSPSLVERKIIEVNKNEKKFPSIVITQFNTLPDIEVKTTPETFNEWNQRYEQIKQELLQNDPDIICLQGIDQFKDFYDDFSEVYNFFFVRNETKEGIQRPGIVLFYKKYKYKFILFKIQIPSHECEKFLFQTKKWTRSVFTCKVDNAKC